MGNHFRQEHISVRSGVMTWIFAILLFITAGSAIAASSDPFPERPVRLIVGFPPGGGLDTVARIMTPKLQEVLGQPWVVDNRTGAAGNIATEVAVKAPADGYTVLMVQGTSLTVSPTLYRLPFDVKRDLQPVIRMAVTNYLLVVNPSVRANSIKEFISFAKMQPRPLSYGSAGVGSPLHLAAEILRLRAGIDLIHVPYKGGGPATIAVLSNEVQIMVGSLSSLLPHVSNGRLKGLGVTGAVRSAVASNIPTIAESGFPGFDVTSWYGLLVPAHTPQRIVRKLYETNLNILKMQDVREAIQKEGLEVSPQDPNQLSTYMQQQTTLFSDVIKRANIRLD